MSLFLQYLLAHQAELEAALGVYSVAAVQNAPTPGTPWSLETLYKWQYETLQTVLPVRRPTQPVSTPAPDPVH